MPQSGTSLLTRKNPQTREWFLLHNGRRVNRLIIAQQVKETVADLERREIKEGLPS